MHINLYAKWQSAYLNFTKSGETYTADGNSYLRGYYGTYYWRNTSGKAAIVKVTIKNTMSDDDGNDASAGIVYLSSTSSDLQTQVAFAKGGTNNSYHTVTNTVNVANNMYLLIFNQNNAKSFYTIQVTGYVE